MGHKGTVLGPMCIKTEWAQTLLTAIRCMSKWFLDH